MRVRIGAPLNADDPTTYYGEKDNGLSFGGIGLTTSQTLSQSALEVTQSGCHAMKKPTLFDGDAVAQPSRDL